MDYQVKRKSREELVTRKAFLPATGNWRPATLLSQAMKGYNFRIHDRHSSSRRLPPQNDRTETGDCSRVGRRQHAALRTRAGIAGNGGISQRDAAVARAICAVDPRAT